METNEAKIQDTAVLITNSIGFLEKEIADPIVYQLVRVDGDGRLVPATQDEVMAVEDLLEDDKCETKFVPDTRQTVESRNIKASEESYSSSIESVNPKIGEEKLNVPVGLAFDLDKIEAPRKVTAHGVAPCSEISDIDQSVRPEICSNPQDALNKNIPSTSAAVSCWKPDFSKLEGKICLDNLTVKELHETFKAAFGRETSVKDKQWLKRRITMGLTNSCDFSCTTFIIRDNLVVKIGEEQECNRVKGRVSADPVVEVVNSDSGGSSGDHDNRLNGDANFKSNSVTKDLDTEQRTAKRVRKPTKRYIEELSEIESMECSEKLTSSDKIPQYRFACPEALIRPTKNAWSNARQDSLGGSGVLVPFVSRIRRSRPRENFMPLLKVQPCGMDIATRQIRGAFEVSKPQEDDNTNNVMLKTGSSPVQPQQPPVAAFKKDEHYSGLETSDPENDVELNDCSEDNSDSNVVTVPTPKGGMRRKHHRPWAISEVVKLVEGVAKYGAGRWSEIKRLAFASCPYRTSVDLKDKWRNLLKAASFMQLPAENGMLNSRKPGVPIPESILSRVRELADIQGQVQPILSTSKLSGHSNARNVHEARYGYL